jgi:pimeloyl-ACP methyl ester carboxylesterase
MTAALLAVAALLLGGAWLWTPDLPLAELEARYAAPPSQRVQAAGLTLHVRDTGPRDAPAVLLLHGFGASLHSWEAWALDLQQQFRVIRVDLPGSGLSQAEPAGDYRDARTLQVLLALLDRLGVAQADVVGHSMGGRLAWKLAAENPSRVRRLVLVAPDGFASPGFAYGQPPEVGPVLRLMKHVLPRTLLRASLAPAYADPAHLSEDDVTRYHDLLRAPGARDALLARLQQMVLQDPTPWLQRVQAPTLLLWGDKDAMIPPANAQDFLRTLPHARLQMLAGVGHLPQEEAPALSLPPVRAFLLAP